MVIVQVELRKWGRSLGAVIPKRIVLDQRLKEGQKINMLVVKKHNNLKKTFGTLKFSRSTQEMLNESDRECWDE